MRLFAGTQWDIPPTCDRCGEPEEICQCPALPVPPAPLIPPEKQTAQVSVEKRKKGKLVTLVRGLPETGNDLPGLLVQLKNSCGAGGTVKDSVIEIQGDHVTRITELLKGMGFKTR